MTTTPDPQLVQELATELMLDAAREVDYMGIGERYFDDERCADLDDEQKEALQYAISDFISEATIVVTAPAEQPQDDGDVRAVRGLTQAASRMLGTWAEANDDVRRELWTTLHDRADDVFDRFRERYAALDAKAVAALEARDTADGGAE